MSIQQILASYNVNESEEDNFPAGIPVWARYKASSMSLSDGSAMSQWDDVSGNGNHATQPSSTNQPFFMAVTPGLTGNTKSVRFTGGGSDGTKDFFLVPSMTGLSAAEMFLFLKLDNVATHNRLHMMGTATDGYYPYPGLGVYECFGRSARVNGIAGTIPATWHVYNVWSGSGDWALSINGSVWKTESSNTPSFRSNPRLGADYDGSSYQNCLEGYLAECVICDSLCSSGQRTDIMTYFGEEYLGL